MVGLISEPAGTRALQGDGTADFPSSVWDRVDPLSTLKQFGRAIGNAQAELGTVDDLGQQTSAPEPTLAPDELAKTYGDNGLKFTTPLPASVAQSMHDAKADELMRQDAARRQPAGIGSSVANFAAGLLDPVNVAAGFIPVLGEARVAGMLARAGLGGLGEDVLAGVAEQGASAIPDIGARMAVRAATGLAGGLAAQAPLVAARYALSRQEQADYSATDAMMDLTYGSLLGGGLHTAIGGIGDLVGNQFRRTGAAAVVDQDPTAREAAMRGAIAGAVEDRPVDVAPSIDIAAADSATREIEQSLAGAPTGAPPARSLPQARPQSLLSFLIDRGGLQDESGELAAMDASKARVALVRRTGGMPFDRARELSEEAGYLQPGSDINDFLNAVAQEVSGRKVYRPDEGALLQRARPDIDSDTLQGHREAVLDAAGEAGVSFTPAEIDHATRLVALDGLHPQDALEEASRATELSYADWQGARQQLGQDSQDTARALATSDAVAYATGRPQPDDALAATQAEAATKLPPVASTNIDTVRLAAAEDVIRQAREAGALDPQSAADLAASDAEHEQAQTFGQAILRAAGCLLRSVV